MTDASCGAQEMDVLELISRLKEELAETPQEWEVIDAKRREGGLLPSLQKLQGRGGLKCFLEKLSVEPLKSKEAVYLLGRTYMDSMTKNPNANHLAQSVDTQLSEREGRVSHYRRSEEALPLSRKAG